MKRRIRERLMEILRLHGSSARTWNGLLIRMYLLLIESWIKMRNFFLHKQTYAGARSR